MEQAIPVLVPHHTDFPIRYDGGTAAAWDTLHIIAAQMEVHPDEIMLDFYEEIKVGVSAGDLGGMIYFGQHKNMTPADEVLRKKEEDGKYHIGLEKKKLADPEGMVAILAHDLALIRLIEEPEPENNKLLAGMTTILFGLGIFNANACFRFNQDASGWGYNRIGHLSNGNGAMVWPYSQNSGERKTLTGQNTLQKTSVPIFQKARLTWKVRTNLSAIPPPSGISPSFDPHSAHPFPDR